MHRVLLTLAILAWALPAPAVDTAVFKCEDKSSLATQKWGSGRGKCLLQCQQAVIVKGDASRDCLTPGFDAETQSCLGDNDAKYAAAVPKVCPTGTFPACGSYLAAGTPQQFVTDQMASLSPLIDASVPSVLCDTDPEVFKKCDAKASKTLSKLAGKLGKCLGKCYKGLQLKGDGTKQCTPDATGDPFDTLDAGTGACVNGSVQKASDAITKACSPLPTCGIWALGLDPVLDLVTANLSSSYVDPMTNPYCEP